MIRIRERAMMRTVSATTAANLVSTRTLDSSYPCDLRSRLLASSVLSGGTLRGLALAAGVSVAAAALWTVPAAGQQSLDGGTATGAFAYA
ncbi:MAG TPA: hypothetical protein VK603_23395, partial [Candidatus Saccharimonadales bacterium]|nr:hypothetical protein [Candidatus Saccharimonadales bacterium]